MKSGLSEQGQIRSDAVWKKWKKGKTVRLGKRHSPLLILGPVSLSNDTVSSNNHVMKQIMCYDSMKYTLPVNSDFLISAKVTNEPP